MIQRFFLNLQASPRCRGVNCESGYKCIEKCETLKGWECVGK